MMSPACRFGPGTFQVSTNGTYAVTTGLGSTMPTLEGADVRLFTTIDGRPQWLSRDQGTLVSVGAPTSARGTDVIGSFDAIELHWASARQPASILMTTAARCYPTAAALVFEQRFPAGLNGTAGVGRDLDSPASSFPAFATASWAATGVRLVTFAGQNAAQSTRYGRWPRAYAGGYLGGPLALVGAGSGGVEGVAILSPLTRPMLQARPQRRERS